MKELRSPDEAHKYLSGEGLPSNKKPFFISLPIKRNLESKEFKLAIKEAFMSDLKLLLSIRFDEKKYASCLSVCLSVCGILTACI